MTEGMVPYHANSSAHVGVVKCQGMERLCSNTVISEESLHHLLVLETTRTEPIIAPRWECVEKDVCKSYSVCGPGTWNHNKPMTKNECDVPPN